ncbi:hypothetical protein B5E88_11125 [Enterococcus cecorum]|uniref:Uncharacterized protein n=1 Tax=Enterococcus cecorum TaxID=44008 RepID=A0A1Y4QT10_9ENTE|nr:hypothetical protein B5E88_11125 [Enterococcus cecorum]CAI3472857.1 hypothetical protein CIRMBP1273_02328 [Enterococcus cecorum]
MKTKKILTLLFISLLTTTITQPISLINNNTNIYTTLAVKYEYRYKVINGILHKRLYNTTTKKFEGNWIPIG